MKFDYLNVNVNYNTCIESFDALPLLRISSRRVR